MISRNELINIWLENTLQDTTYDLKQLAGDASFRCYYRVITDKQSYILMDAPPTQECCKSFIAIDALLIKQGIHAPKIFHQNLEDGFLLLEDFGDEVLLNILSPNNANQYYQIAIDVICQMQSIHPEPKIPTFDESFIRQELDLFKTWFLDKLLLYKISKEDESLLDNFFERLIQNILKQPYTFIHRDYHARNLMRLNDNTLGILDFQDAMLGPRSYDLVSLLKDAYITWPREKQEQWLGYYYDKAITLKLFTNNTLTQFINDFEIMGLQRHLKIVGIFARLYKRDGKAQYLNDIPRVLHYIIDALTRTNNHQEIYQLFIEKFMPSFEQFQWTNDKE